MRSGRAPPILHSVDRQAQGRAALRSIYFNTVLLATLNERDYIIRG